MRTTAVLPVKSFSRAKQRLGDALGGDEREQLAAAMVADVLSALGAVPEIDDVVVVTAEPLAARARRRAGVTVVDDPEEAGQSAAASLGIDAALVRGADRALLVPGDCPALDPREVARCWPGREPVGVIVPDRHGSGTNALLLSPPVPWPRPSARLVRPSRRAGGRRRRDRKICELPSLGPRRRHAGRPRRPGPARAAARRRGPHACGARPAGPRATV